MVQIVRVQKTLLKIVVRRLNEPESGCSSAVQQQLLSQEGRKEGRKEGRNHYIQNQPTWLKGTSQ
jgi:hypothetical protein